MWVEKQVLGDDEISRKHDNRYFDDNSRFSVENRAFFPSTTFRMLRCQFGN